MAFWLYSKHLERDRSRRYVQERSVRLAGGGLIWEACNSQLRDEDTGWMVTGAELVVAEGADAGSHAIIIDTAPSRPTVSLFEIRSVAGYSYADWTPLMFTLEQLFTDAESPTTVEEMKREFNDASCPRAVVRDFLYLTGGYKTGTWNWGGNSRTTAVLLWEDTWSFFQAKAAAQ